MKKNSNSKVETTSRRQFTHAVVTAAVAAPIAASMAGCGSSPSAGGPSTAASPGPTPSPTTGPCTVTVENGVTVIKFAGAGVIEEHIPPMGVDGGGSVIIDSRIKLATSDTGGGPFTYSETGVAQDRDRYGEIEELIVLTETSDRPYFDGVIYKAIPARCQLLLWYQQISQNPTSDDDADFPQVAFPDNDPDVRFVGGRTGDLFKMVVKTKKLDPEDKSHKLNRPNRYKHSNGGGLGRHFRIGQWRIVDRNGATLVGGSGAENYTFFIRYEDFQ